MAQSHLRNVRKAAQRVQAAEKALEAAIVAAHNSGESLRDIAPYAGISYTRVHQIIREAQQRDRADV